MLVVICMYASQKDFKLFLDGHVQLNLLFKGLIRQCGHMSVYAHTLVSAKFRPWDALSHHSNLHNLARDQTM